jgi:TRAP-type C4-dicarboxylate transport system substrate-binding protein
MKKCGLGIVMILAFLYAAPGILHGQTFRSDQKIFKAYFNAMIYQNNWQGKIMEGWAREIEEKTAGAIKIEIYWPGQLPFKASEVLNALRDRHLEIAECLTSYYGSSEPLMDIAYKIFLFQNVREYEKSSKEVTAKHFGPIYDKYNVVPLIETTSGGDQNWFSRNPVTKMADMKGVKCRVYNRSSEEVVKAWGCVPVTIPIVELSAALKRGAADAMVTSFTTGTDVKIWEIFPYATDINFIIGGHNTVLINKAAWGDLPPKVQSVIREASIKASNEVWNQSETVEKKLRELFRSKGVQVLQLDSGEREKLKRSVLFLWKDWLGRNGEKGEAMLRDVEKSIARPVLAEIKGN